MCSAAPRFQSLTQNLLKKVKISRKVAMARDLGTRQIQNCKSMGKCFCQRARTARDVKDSVKKASKKKKKKIVLKRPKGLKMEGSQ